MSHVFAHTFIAHLEDRPGALARVVGLIRRRGYNIDALTVGRTERPDVSRVTLVVQADLDTARRIEANLYKQVNVLYVEHVEGDDQLVRELALVKVRADQATRGDVLKLCEV